MVKYQVEVSDEAKNSLKNIYTWLKEEESITIARKVRDGILDSIARLSTMPQRHRIVEEISDDQFVFRRVLKWSYLIIYSIDESTIKVQVLEIAHAKIDPKNLQNKFGK